MNIFGFLKHVLDWKGRNVLASYLDCCFFYLPDCLYRMLELWILWSSSFTNLLFLPPTLSPDNFLVSVAAVVVILLSVVIAGDKLPARVLLSDTWRDLFTCRGLTGEGVASSRGTLGGGTISATFPARPLPRGIGSEDGRVILLELTRGLR